MFRSGLFTEGQLLHSILDLMTNTWAILTILAGNIVLTVRSQQYTRKMNLRRKGIITLLISVTILSITAATLIYFDVPYFSTPSSGIGDFLRILAAAIMVDLMVAMSCLLFHLSISSKQALKAERAEKHRTEYQYERLKQQINPHFLFNSLGILDYLVQEHETERASVFIRKLANMYRYMLNNDNKELVKLSEEIDFTMMYVDLLKERFVEGMVIDIDIDKTMNNRYVVPCSIQLLVENATKHNIVAAESPLHISIKTEGELLVVRNNLQQRTHGQPSTHLGLANISRQYLDNTECKERSLPKYSQTNVYLSYDLKCGRKGLKSTVLGVNFNNIFNRHYAAGGWVYSAIVGDDYPQDSRYYQIGYIPMAGFTVMGHITLKF